MVMVFVERFKTIVGQCRNIQGISAAIESVYSISIHVLLEFFKV